jgi:hypothetical protein
MKIATDDNKEDVGRFTCARSQCCMQPWRLAICGRTLLPKSHAALLRFYCTEKYFCNRLIFHTTFLTSVRFSRNVAGAYYLDMYKNWRSQKVAVNVIMWLLHLLDPPEVPKKNLCICRVPQEEMSIFWEVIISVILSKKLYMYRCPIPNDFLDRAISLYSSKILDKKEILHTVSNTGIYCSSDKVGTVYLV